jgi:CheY-like chemotaxis protein
MKFHNKGSQAVVKITVATQDEYIRMNVCDNGIGIPQDLQQKLFQQFVQLNSDVTRLYGGTGLGLSICKHIVECMGGSIWLENSQKEVGSTFSFKFTAQPAPEEQIFFSGLRRKSVETGDDLSNCNILVAEDNAVNRKVIKHMLSAIGVGNITIVEDGKQATIEFTKNNYDLVILDIGMPVMNGIEAAIVMREHETLHQVLLRTPIMACTADITASKHNECLTAGIDDVVTKPVTKIGLKMVILRLLRESPK